MQTSISCPHCGHTTTGQSTRILGKRVTCPACRQPFTAGQQSAFDVVDEGPPARQPFEIPDPPTERPRREKSQGRAWFWLLIACVYVVFVGLELLRAATVSTTIRAGGYVPDSLGEIRHFVSQMFWMAVIYFFAWAVDRAAGWE